MMDGERRRRRRRVFYFSFFFFELFERRERKAILLIFLTKKKNRSGCGWQTVHGEMKIPTKSVSTAATAVVILLVSISQLLKHTLVLVTLTFQNDNSFFAK